MKDQLVSFETAKLAKEKEFDIPVYYLYTETRRLEAVTTDVGYNTDLVNMDKITPINANVIRYSILYSAPTQSLLQKWLREVKLMNVIVSPHGLYEYDVDIYTNKIGEVITFNKSSQVYEEIFEFGLQIALKLLSSNT